MNKGKFLAVDVETTCWDEEPPSGQYAEIIEIGIVEVIYGARRRMRWFVKPRVSTISEFCRNLTKITAEQVRQHGLSYREVCAEIRKHFNVKLPWVSWGEFDYTLFHNAAADEIARADASEVDTLRTLRRETPEQSNGLFKPSAIVFPFDGPHLDAQALAQIKLGLKSSDEVLQHFGIDRTEPKHRADADAMTLVDIMHALCDLS